MENETVQLHVNCERQIQKLRGKLKFVYLTFGLSMLAWLITLGFIIHSVNRGVSNYESSMAAMQKSQAQAVNSVSQADARVIQETAPAIMGIGYIWGFRDAGSGRDFPPDVVELMKYYIATNKDRQNGQIR